MKRIVVLILALIMVFGLIACGAEQGASANNAPANNAPANNAPANDAAAEAIAPEDAKAMADAGTLTSDPLSGYELADPATGDGLWHFSNYPNYKDFKADGVVKVAFVCRFSGAWFTPKSEALDATLKEAGYEYLFIDSNSDEQAFLDGVQNIINQDFDVCVLSPVNATLLPEVTTQLQEAGIAYLTTDDPGVDGYGFNLPHYGLNDWWLHNEMGKYCAEKLAEKGFFDDVADDWSNFRFVLLDAPSVDSTHLRNQGFFDAITAAYDIPEDSIAWLDCGACSDAEMMEKLSSYLQANKDSVDKWIVSGGTANCIAPVSTLFKENNIDLNNLVIGECLSTKDILDVILADEKLTANTYGTGVLSAPSGNGIAKIIIELVENGTPIPAFTGYDLNIVSEETIHEFYNTYYAN